MRRLVYLPFILVAFSGCEIFVSGTGGNEEPCFGDGTCKDDYFCDSSYVCLRKCPSCVSEWISIPGGAFEMGSERFSTTEPVRSVTVASFEIMKTEATVKLYFQCVLFGACSAPALGEKCNRQLDTGPSQPINCVDWNQASTFCRWAGARLPSEAEWEFAARGGGYDIQFPWGDEEASCQYSVIHESGDIPGCGKNGTWDVCSRLKGNTSQGLCDMAGNVEEWLQDFYHINYIGAPSDASAWQDPPTNVRASRGGSWYHTGLLTQTYLRSSHIATYTSSDLGFRCARSSP